MARTPEVAYEILARVLRTSVDHVVDCECVIRCDDAGLPVELCATRAGRPLLRGPLSEAICCLDRLESLDLTGRGIDRVPAELGRLWRLRVLNLSSNHLSWLPDPLRELQSLTHLDLSYNLLSSLPELVCELAGLRELALSHNLLTQIPTSIARLTRLLRVTLDDNYLLVDELPPALRAMKVIVTADDMDDELFCPIRASYYYGEREPTPSVFFGVQRTHETSAPPPRGPVV